MKISPVRISKKKRRHKSPGLPPASLVPAPTDAGSTLQITLTEYNEDAYEECVCERMEEVFPQREGEWIKWIHIAGIQNVKDVQELQQMGEHFGLHLLALEDVLNTHQRAKLESYQDHCYLVTHMIVSDANSILVSEQISLFLSDRFLITIQESSNQEVFEMVRKRIRLGRGYSRQMGHDYLAYMLIDTFVDHYFPVLEDLGEHIDQLEDELLESQERRVLKALHQGKRTLLQLRRLAWPNREMINQLQRDESGIVRKETKVFLRDLYDHSIQIIDILEMLRDTLAGLMDFYLSSMGNRTNEIVRLLTIISTIFIPLTFIVGLYGMNFDGSVSKWNMPELRWEYGYLGVLGAMFVLALGLAIYFRRKHWW